jgi:hypothetical protein
MKPKCPECDRTSHLAFCPRRTLEGKLAWEKAVMILRSPPMRRFMSVAISPDGYERLVKYAETGKWPAE